MKPDAQKLEEPPIPDSASRLETPGAHIGMNAFDENRVRNILSVIRSFIRRTAEGSVTVEDYAAHLEARVDAYTRLLSMLGKGDHDVSLSFLVADTLDAFATRENDNFTIAGPDVTLRGKAAESLGLALNELALNALEHGALSHGGSLHISWTADLCLNIRWRECLLSPPSFARSGLGLKFLHGALPFALNAKVDREYSQDELTWRIEVPQGTQWTAHTD